MDAICSTGFGLDVDSQRNPDNPFIKHAKMIVEQSFSGNPLVMFARKSTVQFAQVKKRDVKRRFFAHQRI